MEDIMKALSAWIAIWQVKTVQDHIMSIFGGGLGATAYIVISQTKIIKPRWVDNVWEPGFVGILIVGSILGFLVDIAVPISIISGAIGFTVIKLINENILPAVANIIIAGAKKKIGSD